MYYPKMIRPFKQEIKNLASYLVQLKQQKQFDKPDKKIIHGLFHKITQSVYPNKEEDYINNFSMAITEGFLDGWKTLHNDIEKQLDIENEVILATMIDYMFSASMNVQNN